MVDELDLTKLPIGTLLKTRDGNIARLLATDLRGPKPVVVAIGYGRDESVFLLSSAGYHVDSLSRYGWDIVGIEKPKIKCMAWLVPSEGAIGRYKLVGGIVVSPHEAWPDAAQAIELDAP